MAESLSRHLHTIAHHPETWSFVFLVAALVVALIISLFGGVLAFFLSRKLDPLFENKMNRNVYWTPFLSERIRRGQYYMHWVLSKRVFGSRYPEVQNFDFRKFLGPSITLLCIVIVLAQMVSYSVIFFGGLYLLLEKKGASVFFPSVGGELAYLHWAFVGVIVLQVILPLYVRRRFPERLLSDFRNLLKEPQNQVEPVYLVSHVHAGMLARWAGLPKVFGFFEPRIRNYPFDKVLEPRLLLACRILAVNSLVLMGLVLPYCLWQVVGFLRAV